MPAVGGKPPAVSAHMEVITMSEIKNEYKCVTDPAEVKAYIGDAKIVSFDYETAPDDSCLFFVLTQPHRHHPLRTAN